MPTILVVGIAVVDLVFQVPQMPSDPIKHRATAMDVVGGGIAANAAVAIQRLGGQAQLLTRLGSDPMGTLIADDLRAEGVDLSHTALSQNARSPVSTVLVDQQGERLLVNYPGDGLAEQATLPPHFDAVLVDTRWPTMALAALNAARAAGVPGVLDAEAPVPSALVEAASHVVFSAQGLRDCTGEPEVEAGLAAITASGWIGTTDGAKGLCLRDGTWLPGFQVEVKDTLGAGDVWHGAFALALAEGKDESDAARFAHVTAALKCTGFGGRKATPTRAEVDAFLGDQQA